MSITGSQFDKVAEEYDFVTNLLNDNTFFIANMPIEKGRALDIGCGTGILVYELSNYFSEVVGIDISEGMLEFANKKRQCSNISYLKMDAENLSLGYKFDYIVSRTTFHHLRDISIVINQMKELLYEGGKIVILDNVSKVETPPTYVYILGAIQEFLPNCFKFGVKNAVRVFKYNTSKSWLEHLASDKYLSEQKYYEIYGKLLPNCTFRRMNWAMGIIWEKPIVSMITE
ncbi:methyltransferase domain-containing protein [Heyndrickxia sp. FSL K6-6286]|mgnify:CR=1 FL=1|uniref:class I SAM-dependent methyltransferase n=1 Tax=Heyndrickxia sp. FSL K6-6286 TaxID=2921510 RepID=UPI00315A993D